MSDFFKFHFEVETLKTHHKNAYPIKFVDICIAKFVNNIFVQKPAFTTVPKLEIRIVLLYLGNISSITKKRFCKLKIIFQTVNRFKNYFRFKDRVPETL